MKGFVATLLLAMVWGMTVNTVFADMIGPFPSEIRKAGISIIIYGIVVFVLLVAAAIIIQKIRNKKNNTNETDDAAYYRNKNNDL